MMDSAMLSSDNARLTPQYGPPDVAHRTVDE